LLATDLPDGRNIADDYLRRRGWKESVSTREYIAGLRRSVISLYEVSGIVPGESMLLRDLVRGGEPVRVWEKSGSQGLRPWDRIATRLGATVSTTCMTRRSRIRRTAAFGPAASRCRGTGEQVTEADSAMTGTHHLE